MAPSPAETPPVPVPTPVVVAPVAPAIAPVPALGETKMAYNAEKLKTELGDTTLDVQTAFATQEISTVLLSRAELEQLKLDVQGATDAEKKAGVLQGVLEHKKTEAGQVTQLSQTERAELRARMAVDRTTKKAIARFDEEHPFLAMVGFGGANLIALTELADKPTPVISSIRNGFDGISSWFSSVFGNLWDKFCGSMAAGIMRKYGFDIHKKTKTNTGDEGGSEDPKTAPGADSVAKAQELQRQKQDGEYKVAVGIFLKATGNYKGDNFTILTNPGFGDGLPEKETFNTLSATYRRYRRTGPTGISDDIGIVYNNKAKSDASVYQAIGVLVEMEDHGRKIGAVLSKKHPYWKDMPIREVFMLVYQDFAVLKSLDGKDVVAFLQGDVSFGNLSFNGVALADSDLKEKLEGLMSRPDSKLNGVSLITLGNIYAHNALAENVNDVNAWTDQNMRGLMSSSPIANREKDQAFLSDFKVFSEKNVGNIKDEMLRLFGPAGSKVLTTEDQTLINSLTLTPRESLEFYVLMGGERDITTMSQNIKDLFYIKVWILLGQKAKEEVGAGENILQFGGQWSALRGKTFNKEVLSMLEGNPSTILPESMRDILNNLIVNTFEGAFKRFARGTVEVWNSLDTGEKLGIAGAVGIGLILLIYSKKLRTLLTGVTIATAAIGGAGLISRFFDSATGKISDAGINTLADSMVKKSWDKLPSCSSDRNKRCLTSVPGREFTKPELVAYISQGMLTTLNSEVS